MIRSRTATSVACERDRGMCKQLFQPLVVPVHGLEEGDRVGNVNEDRQAERSGSLPDRCEQGVVRQDVRPLTVAESPRFFQILSPFAPAARERSRDLTSVVRPAFPSSTVRSSWQKVAKRSGWARS